MKPQMKQQEIPELLPEELLPELSALFDDELGHRESQRLLRRAASEEELRKAWQVYALIGDQLRHERDGAPDLTAAIMDKIRAQPVVLAPRALLRRSQYRPALALAASVAGIAVVGWLALAGDWSDKPATTWSASTPAKPPTKRGEINEYVLAHYVQASSFRLGDNADHVRIVAPARASGRP